MNAKIKKVISVFVMLCFFATQSAVFAEDTVGEETVSLAEKYLNEVGNRWTWKMEGDNKLAYKAWLVNSATTAPTQKDNTQSTKLISGHGTVLKFPMPKPEAGQKIGKYILQLSSADSIYGNSLDVLKLSGENYDVSKFTTSGAPYSTVIENYKANPEALSAIERDAQGNKVIDYEATSIDTVYRNFIDITTYVNDLYNAGQRDHFYVIYGCSSSQRNIVVNTTWSSYTPADVDQASFHSFAPADELALSESVPSEGSKVLITSPVSMKFNNGIENAIATVNGKEVPCSVSGTTVTVDINLEQYENYTVTLNVTDVYQDTGEYTITFVTTGSDATAKLKNGITYHIKNSADPVEVTAKMNVDQRNSQAMVYRIPVPQVPAGRMLDTFTFTPVAFSQSASYAYKLPGDDWELTEDKNDDGLLLRYSDISSYKTSGNYVCPLSDRIVTDLDPDLTKNKHYQQVYDITSYVNECIARGEEYIDILVGAGNSTMDMFGFKAASWDSAYEATYEYSLLIPEFKAVNIEKTTGIASLDSLSFKLLTDIDSLTDKIKVRNADTKEVVGAEFTYDATRKTVTLSSPVSLPFGATYEIVLTECTDKFGNTLSEDLVITTVDVPKAIEASAAKIVSADSSLAYDDESHLTALDKSASYKAVAKVTNNTNAPVDVIVAIAEYVDDEAVSIAFTTVTVPANTKDFDAASEAVSLSGVSGKAKAFVWVEADNEPLVLNSAATIN